MTDVPYDKESIPLCAKLSEVASKVVRPGGLIAVMSGVLYIEQWLHELTRNLDFVWVFACVMQDHGLAVPRVGWQQPFAQRWKPVLVLSNGRYTRTEIWSDVLAAPMPIKSLHPHEQSVETMSAIIERVSKPGDLVLDTCCGSGTTGVAALRLNRPFIGVDLDAAAVEVAAARLAALPIDDLALTAA